MLQRCLEDHVLPESLADQGYQEHREYPEDLGYQEDPLT